MNSSVKYLNLCLKFRKTIFEVHNNQPHPLRTEKIITIFVCLIQKVMAEDFDGPSNSHVRYSIVDGNQGSPFTLDPLRGELKVARQLDRERVRPAADTALFTCSLIR